MTKALGYAAKHSFSRLKPLEFDRPEPNANEVQIDVLYCGVCTPTSTRSRTTGATRSTRAFPGTRSSAALPKRARR